MGVGCSSRSATREESFVRSTDEEKLKQGPIRRQISETSSSEVAVQVKKDLSHRSEVKGQQEIRHEVISMAGDKTEPTPVHGERPVSQAAPGQPRVSTPSFQIPPPIASLPERVQKVLMGHIDDIPTKIFPKTIHLLSHSIQTDSRRIAFMSQLAVKLRTFCAGQGFDLDIIDLSSGAPGQMLTPLEFHREELSTYLRKTTHLGVTRLHMILFGDDLGEASMPGQIAAQDFLSMTAFLEKDSDKAMFFHWFKLDDSSQTYILQPIKNANSDTNIWESWIVARKTILHLMTTHCPVDLLVKYCAPCLEKTIGTVLSQREKAELGAKEDIILLVDDKRDGRENDTQSRADSGLDDGNADSPNELLRKRILQNINNENVLDFNLKNGDDDESKPSSSDIKVFCDKLYNVLTAKLSRMMDDRITQTSLPVPVEVAKNAGNISKLNNEICQVFEFCKTRSDPAFYQQRPDMIGRIQSYVESSSNQVLVVTGAAGSGKTALIASFVLETDQKSRKYCTVIRFVGQLPFSACLNKVLDSISKQIGVLTGSTSSQEGHTLSDLLSGIPSSCPLLLVIDGVDQCPQWDGTLDWLPTELPSHVKFVVTTTDTGPVYEQIKVRLPDLNCYLDIPPLDAEAALAFLEKSTSIKPTPASPFVLQQVKQNVHKCTLPMQITLITELMWFSSDENMDNFMGANLDDLVISYIQLLEQTWPDAVVGRVLGYLCASRLGLTDSELRDLLSCDENVLTNILGEATPEVRLFPAHAWIKLREELSPFLDSYVCNGTLLNCIKTGVFRKAVDEIHRRPNLSSVHSALTDYFTSRWAIGKQKPYVDKNGVIDSLADRYVLPQPLQTNVIANERKLTELPYHVFYSAGSDTLCVDYLFDADWLFSKISAVGVEEVLGDIALCKQKQNNEINVLKEFLALSAQALDADANQLSQQLQQRVQPLLNDRLSAFPLLNKLLKSSIQLKCQILKTSDACLRPVLGTETSNSNEREVTSVTALARVPSDPDHVISLSQGSGEVSVWEVHTLQKSTKLSGLCCPRSIRMFDGKRAAVLCDREISIYHLSTGEMESKLKGVLNAKMPFYGIHDDKHVVSLSRNRMYVNITNTDSGDMVSTFKVGESRFLDSLLVSANGVMTVCGDETQKPFPLLVWNLPERKLVHDLRIPRHEFLTSISDISDDGHYVACVAKELDSPSPNFIVVYDLMAGQIFKKWKPSCNTTCLSMSSRGKSVVSGLENGTLLDWGLTDGTLRHEISGRGGPAESLTLSEDGKRAATVNRVSVCMTVCLYDLVKGDLLGTFTPDCPITCCQISARGELVLIGLQDRSGIISLQPSLNDIPDGHDCHL